MNKFVKLLLPLPILLSPAIALAGTKTSLSANINSGSLTITAPSVSANFTGVHLNGQVQKSYATLSNWYVTDATGTGNGWTVDLSASQLKEVPPSGGFASGTSAKTLPLGSLNLSGVRSVTADNGSLPVDTTGGPLIENSLAVIDSGSQIDLVKAFQNFGMGMYTVNEPHDGLTLTLNPSSTEVDTVNYPSSPTPYESVLTYTVASAPSTITINRSLPTSISSWTGDVTSTWNTNLTQPNGWYFDTSNTIPSWQAGSNSTPRIMQTYFSYDAPIESATLNLDIQAQVNSFTTVSVSKNGTNWSTIATYNNTGNSVQPVAPIDISSAVSGSTGFYLRLSEYATSTGTSYSGVASGANGISVVIQ